MLKAVFLVLLMIRFSEGSVLSTAAAGLSPGQSVSFSNGTSMDEADFAWQADAEYDAQRQLVHVMGKPANADQSWQHSIYDIATAAWTPAVNLGWNASGHIYGNFALDPATGDLFQSIGGSKRIRRYDKASGAWTQLSVDIYSGSISSHLNGIAWHPNLYGPGDGGLVVQDENRTMFWRKSANTVQNFYTGAQTLGVNAGHAIYFATIDKVIVGQTQHVTVSPNGANMPAVVNVGAPPIKTGGLSTVYNLPYGTLVQHPAYPSKILILERRGSYRVWESADGDNWTLKSYSHPFTFNEFVIISLPDMGVLWAVGANGSTAQSKLWRPDDSPSAVEIRMPDRMPAVISAFPNPFRDVVTLKTRNAGVLTVFGADGRLIATLGDAAAWDASGMPSGIYILKADWGDKIHTKQLFLSK